jgi:hypothetical protein
MSVQVITFDVDDVEHNRKGIIPRVINYNITSIRRARRNKTQIGFVSFSSD